MLDKVEHYTEKRERQKIKRSFEWQNHTSLIGLILVLIVSFILTPNFLSSNNIMNLFTQVSSLGLLAIGMTFVILIRGIDLSVGSLLALSSVIIGLLTPKIGLPMTLVIVLLLGALIGVFHGYLITNFFVPAFIVTLAGLTAYRGTALFITGSASIPIDSDLLLFIGLGRISPIIVTILLLILFIFITRSYLKLRKSGSIDFMDTGKYILKVIGLIAAGILFYQTNGITFPFFVFLIVLIFAWFVLNKTVFGREVYAIGSNPEAAKLAGINVRRNTIIIYTFMGFLAALAGIITTARLGSGTPQIGNLNELDAIAAVIIGGTSLMGGIGTLGGTVIGLFLIGVINNILSLLNVTSTLQMIIKGAIILIAVVLDTKFGKK